MTKEETVKFCDELKARYPFDFKKTYAEVYVFVEKLPAGHVWRALETERSGQAFAKTGFSFEKLISNATHYEGYGDIFFQALRETKSQIEEHAHGKEE